MQEKIPVEINLDEFMVEALIKINALEELMIEKGIFTLEELLTKQDLVTIKLENQISTLIQQLNQENQTTKENNNG